MAVHIEDIVAPNDFRKSVSCEDRIEDGDYGLRGCGGKLINFGVS